MISMIFDKHREKILYLITGGWNTVFGYGSFALLYYYLSGHINYLIILTISYVISITNSYISYKLLVFRTKGGVIREYLRFYVVYGGSFLVNIVLLPLMIERYKLNAYLSQACIVMVTIMASYLMHKKFTFKRNRYETDRA
jgi:putative flippase GtrA